MDKNLIDGFFLILIVRSLFHGKHFKQKKALGYQVNSQENGSFAGLPVILTDYILISRGYHAELTKEREQPPVVILQQTIHNIYFVLCG